MKNFDPRVRAYLDDVIQVRDDLVSVILFGSAATGGFASAVSDADLIIVVRNDSSPESRRSLRAAEGELEIRHGLSDGRKPGALESFVNRITGTAHSLFVCTRDDLLSGKPARVFGVPAAQAVFVDRIVIPGIVFSACTVWGEELRALIPLPQVRRLDVFKALFSLLNQALLFAELFPVLPNATRYAMGALKHSVHSCYFCYHGRPAALEEEVAFFQSELGPAPALVQLLLLRREYGESFKFVVRCIPAVVRLHWRTAFGNRFPRSLEKQI
ncbi:MAG TPA: nucleotidyltransferase domain-containing protein [Bryobacteraceae bacterium]|jgi:predicted nucleotidyltransferase|nr:nucleotidyltransferase domain-containing protein [Bryobacteraceae bacterium]